MALGPFLLRHLWDVHQVGDEPEQYLFKLCPGRHGEVSIRYRVRLAARIVEQACREPWFDRKNDRLLIVNAGAAGLSAALAAAGLGINVRLCSRDEKVGGPLRGCTTRIVDPCIYFWPRGDHWTEDEVRPSEDEPLAWTRNTADEITQRCASIHRRRSTTAPRLARLGSSCPVTGQNPRACLGGCHLRWLRQAPLKTHNHHPHKSDELRRATH